MSEWYEAKDGEFGLDTKQEQVDIYVKQNDFGAVYVTLTFKQVLALAAKITALRLK